MHTQYYEGVLQLRNVNNEVIDFVYALIERREGIGIAKIERYKNGMDVYLSSQKYLQIVGRQLQKNFGGALNVTGRLHGTSRTSSKKVYRITVLFRMPSFKKGDIITYKGRELLVLNLGKKVFCRDTESGKKTLIGYDKLD